MSIESKEININQECTVVLQSRGLKAIEKYYSNLGLKPPREYSVGDQYSAPLWDIMNVFGGYTFMGPPPPFETVIKLEAL